MDVSICGGAGICATWSCAAQMLPQPSHLGVLSKVVASWRHDVLRVQPFNGAALESHCLHSMPWVAMPWRVAGMGMQHRGHAQHGGNWWPPNCKPICLLCISAS